MRKIYYAICLSAIVFISGSVRADLVGYWSFDDESADDLSGNDNNGELLGVLFSDDTPTGEGMSLDTTTGGTVQVPHSDSLGMTDSMTIAYWMRAENLDQTSEWNGTMGKISDPRGENGAAGGPPGWEMQRFAAESRIDIRIDTSELANTVVGNLTGTFDDEWVHVAWTVDEGFWESYLDGELVGSGEYPHGDGFGNESDLFFGNRGNCCAYAGLLDEIAIYDNILSEVDIASLAEGNSPIGNPPGNTGDFDGDNDLDVDDVNTLIAQINGDKNAAFDVTGDGEVNGADLSNWVKQLKNTWIGDANLDGEFGSGDLVGVFQAGKFETGLAAGWGDGDWNGDGVFGTGDLVVAFQDGGFEAGPRGAVSAVPEPTSLVLFSLGLLAIVRRRR